ncbi:hypothetical protein B0H63DRAFT_471070 [Podospora didyma]|uniref:Fungal lipase-type domain-containing protein n=1 Tax=Podospora didyma TaxID=330526 RepID=A0AAE0U1T7_9PEZI|nr:hypothetical protein B0H63DRAFT_471070 [Podospora didyma]
MWTPKAFKTRAAKASMHSAVTLVNSATTLTPNSQVASAANSQASSAAVAELTAGLGFVFDQLGGEDEPGDLVQLHLERLAAEAAKYRCSRVADGTGEDWTCSHAMSQLLQAACRCSSLVYEPSQQPSLWGLQLAPVLHRTPSMMGTVKAASMWKIDHVRIPGWSGKTLMVSIRGTATKADHMVNMNGESKDASSVFKLEGVTTSVNAHAGFLACAKTLIPTLTRDIVDQIAVDGAISNIVFTGHSAGGAVASLVFLNFVCHSPAQLSSVKYSLVTFGAAPATSQSLTELCRKQPNVGLLMAFVNEYDMISRSDKAYLRSIVDLYRSKYGLPPVASPLLDHQKLAETGGSLSHIGTTGPSISSIAVHAGLKAGGVWPLPPPVFHLLGDIIVLRICFDSPEMKEDSDDAVSPEPLLKTDKVSPDEFCKLLFCDISVHRRTAYLERLNMLVGEIRLREFGSVGGDTANSITEDFAEEVLVELGVTRTAP